MEGETRLLNQEEAAGAAALAVAIVRWLAERELIDPAGGYTEADLAQLRRVHRLIEDLELDQPAIEVVLRMRQRLLALQAELQRLETELRGTRRTVRLTTFIDAEWTDLD
jgi:hypothetical protein